MEKAITQSVSFKNGLQKACLRKFQATNPKVVKCETSNLRFEATSRRSLRGLQASSKKDLLYTSALTVQSDSVAELDTVASAVVVEAADTEPAKLQSFEQILKESIAEEVAQAAEADPIAQLPESQQFKNVEAMNNVVFC